MTPEEAQAKEEVKKKLQAIIEVTMAVGDAIKEFGQVPNGHLYAQLMGNLSFETYMAIISALKEAGVVKETNHLLIWIGSNKEQTK